MRFDPSRLAEYKRRHEGVWFEMQTALARSGWREYSLFCRDDGYAVGFFEAEGGRTFQECVDAMAAEPINAKWQLEMRAFTADGSSADAAAAPLDHYFYLGADRVV